MPTEVVLPRLGLTQDDGTVVRWFKAEGSRVTKGEPLFEVMTDKATLEIEAPASGVLLRILAAEGATVPVATPIALIGEAGEAVPPAPAVPEAGVGGTGAREIPAAAQRVPAAADSQAPAGGPATGPALLGTAAAATATDGPSRLKVSPRARALAEMHGVDVRLVAGTGPGGRIVEMDVRAAMASRPAPAPGASVTLPPPPVQAGGAPASPAAPSQVPPPSQAPVASRRRAIIARRMMESLHTTAQLTLTTDVDMEETVKLRGEVGPELERRDKVHLSYTDLIVRAAAIALREHPGINARWEGEGVRRLNEIHVGVAVALDEGLVVPVVRRADQMTLAQTSAAIRDLSERARTNRLKPEEMQGSTFTVTNLGMYDVDAFTPVLNPPEAAILGVGRLHRRPVAVGDRVEIRPTLVLSLTFDHRIVDGAPAGQFLQRVKQILEHPYLLLLP
jgi:pyruvate dehydrogenase E2 component (dihydrolipoamide acetyltransferase)